MQFIILHQNGYFCKAFAKKRQKLYVCTKKNLYNRLFIIYDYNVQIAKTNAIMSS